MNTLKDLLDKLYEESETRNKKNMEVRDFESISYEVGVQSTIKEIREWVEEHKASLEAPNGNIITFVEID